MTQGRLVFIGTYSEPIRFGTGQILQGRGRGIHVFRHDPASGTLEPVTVAEGVRNPSFLSFAPSHRFLYCVNEFKEFEGMASGAVSAFALDPATGALRHLNTRASHGTDPCHLIVDHTGRFVLLANFASGSVAVLPILADGSLGEACTVVQHEGSSVDPVRQKGPHAHGVTMDAQNRHLFVPDLGLDRVLIYRFDETTGGLTPNAHQPWVATAPGAGPRQLVLHPSAPFAFLINELDSTMTAFAYDAGVARLEPIQTLPTLPAGFSGRSTCAEVQLTPSGRFLYGSNRGHNSLAGYAVDPSTGRLTPIGHTSTGGEIPRHFEISPDGDTLVAANQDTGNLVVMALDPATGALRDTGNRAEVGTPVCVQFL